MKRDRFGQRRDPAFAYATFVHGKLWGQLPKWMTWQKFNERYRQRKKLRKIARHSRRRNAKRNGHTKAPGKGG